jgi:hypothetical protein
VVVEVAVAVVAAVVEVGGPWVVVEAAVVEREATGVTPVCCASLGTRCVTGWGPLGASVVGLRGLWQAAGRPWAVMDGPASPRQLTTAR